MATVSDDIEIFILGVTGYLGGAVAHGVKKAYPAARCSAWVRSQSKVDIILKYGFQPIVATGDAAHDMELVKAASANADVVINTADADDLALTSAILDGLKSSKKTLPILIHTRYAIASVLVSGLSIRWCSNIPLSAVRGS
jgi:hypothetical protein